MTSTPAKTKEIKPFVKKPSSPFNTDPHNNRNGRSGAGGSAVSGNQKIKSINVPKFKGGSGGDR
jgi:hypothetical protein